MQAFSSHPPRQHLHQQPLKVVALIIVGVLIFCLTLTFMHSVRI